MFERSYLSDLDNEQSRVDRSVRDLEKAGFWKTKNDVNCWNINNVIISQTSDGLVRYSGCLNSEPIPKQTLLCSDFGWFGILMVPSSTSRINSTVGI